MKMEPSEIFKKSVYLLIIFFLFAIDRLSKIFILNILEKNDSVDIYVSSFLNLYLVWNKGIAFGLFSFNEIFIYNIITLLIALIIIIIFVMIVNSKDIRKYFFILIAGGALGNFFDRLYYSAVPDFIDFHINNFHWFIFNVADIFISIGIICLIIAEIFDKKKSI